MGATAVNWLPLLAVFAASLVAGALLVWRARASARNLRRQPEAELLARRDLLGKRDALLQQLRELEDTAAKRTPEQLALERYALELEAAQILRELDTPSVPLLPPRRKGASARAAAAAAVPVPAGNPALRGFLWGTASMAAVALLLFLVIRAVQPREQGGSVTGEIPTGRGANGSEAARPASGDAREAQLKAAVARNPEDVETRLELVRVYLVRQDFKAAWEETRTVLERSPEDARALTYMGVIRSAAGQPEVAVTLFRRAIAKKPDLLEAYLQLAYAYVRLNRGPDAEATLEVASRRFPEKAAMLSRMLARMRQQTEQEEAAASGAPPAEGAQTSRRVAGVVDLDPALRGKLAPGAIVWVTVRQAGVAQGPPVAVKRLSASAFPIPFSVGDADAMAGQPFPEKVRIEARVDSDGDPTTRDPSDPSARLDGVMAGATNLRLAMARSGTRQAPTE